MNPKDLLIAKMFAQPNRPQPVMTNVSETGKPVQGQGTGTSDEVPAEVTDENDPSAAPQKAALSKDEYVVRADIVRKLGRGNPELGAKMLDQILENVFVQSEPKIDNNQVPKGLASVLGAKK